MSSVNLRQQDRNEAQAAKEAAATVFELATTLPKKVLSEIYADVMLDLGLAAGLRPRKQRVESSEHQVDDSRSKT